MGWFGTLRVWVLVRVKNDDAVAESESKMKNDDDDMMRLPCVMSVRLAWSKQSSMSVPNACMLAN